MNFFGTNKTKSMRRRQQESSMLKSEVDPETLINKESKIRIEEKVDERDSLKPLMAAFEFSRSHHDDNQKSISILPRNYNSRRRLVIAGCCFIVALVIFQASNRSGKDFLCKVLLHHVCTACWFLCFLSSSRLFDDES